MSTARRWRIAVASTSMLFAMVGLVALGLLGINVVPGDVTSAHQEGIVELPELGICMQTDLIASAASPPDPACANCPKRIPGEPCTRISCDPCCYRCSGDPIPRCY